MRGDFTGISGYARCTREYAQALIESGIDLRIENNKKEATTPNISPFWSEELPKRIVQEDAPCKIKIWHETPQFWKPRENVFNIGYTTFECFSIPDVPIKGMLSYNWVAQCNRMDLIMVPSKFNKRTFIESGVTTPIEVIPHIIPEAPLPRPEPYFPADPKATRYLSIFQWNPRKDPMSLLIAFWLASVKNSRLLLKTYDAGFNEKNAGLVTHIRAIKDSFHINVSGVVNPILNKLSSEEIDKLIATADVYVTSTRGEGFGLPPVESMMAGIPVIGPYGTAFLWSLVLPTDAVDAGRRILLSCCHQESRRRQQNRVSARRRENLCAKSKGQKSTDSSQEPFRKRQGTT